jgi:putative oxidoreductase
MLKKMFMTTQDIVPLILRLTLGIVILPHGAQKLLGWFGGHGLGATMQAMTSAGLPVILVFLVIMAESFGALGLIFGFLTRFSAFGIGLVMLGAIVTVHAKFGFFMNWLGRQPGEGFEYHLLAIGIALALLIRGGGVASLDGLLQKRFE